MRKWTRADWYAVFCAPADDGAGGAAAGGGSAGAGGAAPGGTGGNDGSGAAGAGAGAGAPAGGAAPGAGGAPAGGNGSAAAAAATPGEGTLLSQAAAAAPGGAPAAGAGADPLATIPEKYRVLGADGKLDPAATLAKVSAAHGALEKRMGEGGAPPETAEGYKVDSVVAALKEANGGQDVAIPKEITAGFNEWALKAKLNQGQYDQALTGFMAMIPTMVDQAYAHAMQNGRTELAKAWGPDGVKHDSPQMKGAVRAFNRFAPPALRNMETMDAIGNHPVVMQILAAVGAELKEDSSISGETGALSNELDTLFASEAYWNKQNPEHEWTVQRVQELMKGGARPKVTRNRPNTRL